MHPNEPGRGAADDGPRADSHAREYSEIAEQNAFPKASFHGRLNPLILRRPRPPIPAMGLARERARATGAGGRVYRGRPGGDSLRGRGARCGAICRVGALGARGNHAVSQADRRRRAADAGARARSLPLGALGAGVLCQLPVPRRTPLNQNAKAAEARGLRGMRGVAVYCQAVGRADEKGERRPSDYHKVLLKRLRDVETRLHAELGEFESRCYVDTGPVVERALAVAAGLGWTGKNTCLIHPQLGSFGFLAVLLTSLESDQSRELKQRCAWFPIDCGTCRRCIEACPTHALDVPYQMDATRCISYLTIEHKGPIAEELMPGMGRQVFGCDICQDVCPWNEKSLRSGADRVDAELEPRPELINPALDWLALSRREVLRAGVQRLAGAQGGIPGPAAQRGHRHGQQRACPVRDQARRVGRGQRRGLARRGAMGAGPAAERRRGQQSRVNSRRLSRGSSAPGPARFRPEQLSLKAAPSRNCTDCDGTREIS